MYDTIIIGAGMSGLAAGIRLAYYGQRVCVLERHYTIGGLNSFYRLRGRDYDVGLHAVTNFTPKGTQDAGRWRDCSGSCASSGKTFELAPQIGSSDGLSRGPAANSATTSACWSPRSPARFLPSGTAFSG
jgi:cation diffusion facilitator CzcD-associated flavoprotein CzcO